MELAKRAREYAEHESRFEYPEIEKRALRIKSAEKRTQFIENSIEEVEIKIAEDKLFIERSDEVNDLEGAYRYLDTLSLTARKLRALLKRERSAIPSMKNGYQSINQQHLSHFELKPGGAEKAVVSKEIKEYLDVKELSSLIGMPMNTIYKLTVNGKIPFTKIGQRIYFKRSKLDRWLEKQERGL